MGPQLIDTFENGKVTLEVYQFTDPLRDTYWIKVGVACLELNEQDLSDLTELLVAFEDNKTEVNKQSIWRRFLGK